jgi:ADP-heptose:LPS heptosyltransferase
MAQTSSMMAAGSVAELSAASTLPVVLSPPIRRIATFHLNSLADLLFTLPALHTLREAFPEAQISTVVRPGLAALLEDSPLVNELLLRPKGGLSAQAALMARLASGHFDIAVSFSRSRQCSLLAFATRAPVRIGFQGAKMEALLSHQVVNEGPFCVDAALDLMRALGLAPRRLDYGGLLQTALSHSLAVDEILEKNGISGPFIVANVSGERGGDKRPILEWPIEHWAQALSELSPRWPVVLVGGRAAPQVTEKLSGAVADFGGKLSLPALAALCGKARLFMGSDGGILHLAAAMQTPVVGIYGPTDWQETGPRGVTHRIVRHPVDCSPCLLTKCKWHGAAEKKCLTQIVPAQVVKAAREIIGA